MEQHQRPGLAMARPHATTELRLEQPSTTGAETRSPNGAVNALSDSGRFRLISSLRAAASRVRQLDSEASRGGTAAMGLALTQPTRAERRILVAENELGNRQLIEQVLALAGYAALTATNGAQALDLLRATPVDLVLLDLSMPVLDGFCTAQLIRAHAEYASLPVVAVSGYARDDVREHALRAGCTAFLTKPFRPRDLLRMVADLLDLPDPN